MMTKHNLQKKRVSGFMSAWHINTLIIIADDRDWKDVVEEIDNTRTLSE